MKKRLIYNFSHNKSLMSENLSEKSSYSQAAQFSENAHIGRVFKWNEKMVELWPITTIEMLNDLPYIASQIGQGEIFGIGMSEKRSEE